MIAPKAIPAAKPVSDHITRIFMIRMPIFVSPSVHCKHAWSAANQEPNRWFDSIITKLQESQSIKAA
jgi:hypothetical protein